MNAKPLSSAPPSPWPQGPSRAEQRQAKRDAVLNVAAQMFNERGFHATSLDDVAAHLNVSKPTLYYYVKNKEEILIACMETALALMLDNMEESRRSGRGPLEQLHDCMHVYGQMATQPFGICLIRVGDEVLPPDSRKELRRMKSEINLQFRHLVGDCVQQGLLAPCDPTVTAFVIQGALSWLARWYQPTGAYSADQIIEQCTQLLLQGVLARPAHSQ
ncbi:TetR/AcrR family transcriptional regulator [Comamonas denitrificans]|uniref:TetR/AcrR family transcriptional regulator n=1 Tax=Comamonas denitrificans TaxID=117506 RepID=A0A939H192_9BURK|nr:TetR/AcrR family transcriptional regulator [Comamonas denitrificans]MBO1250513.1 TetR/AcrR family transcriptional regulator [Comamonas denitrificans]